MLKKGFKVSGCDNLIGGDIENVPSQVTFYKGNCEDLDFMTRSIKDNVDVVCHSAAYAHEFSQAFSPTLICSNNVTGSTSVFTAAIKIKLKELFFCSSMARYGNINIPFRENDVLNQSTLMEFQK